MPRCCDVLSLAAFVFVQSSFRDSASWLASGLFASAEAMTRPGKEDQAPAHALVCSFASEVNLASVIARHVKVSSTANSYKLPTVEVCNVMTREEAKAYVWRLADNEADLL